MVKCLNSKSFSFCRLYQFALDKAVSILNQFDSSLASFNEIEDDLELLPACALGLQFVSEAKEVGTGCEDA